MVGVLDEEATRRDPRSRSCQVICAGSPWVWGAGRLLRGPPAWLRRHRGHRHTDRLLRPCCDPEDAGDRSDHHTGTRKESSDAHPSRRGSHG